MSLFTSPDAHDERIGIDQDADRLYAMLMSLILDLEKRLAAHLAAHGISTPQFYVLKTLSEQGGSWGIGRIAREHGLTNAAMTGLVTRMEAFDPPLVTRHTSPTDRRGVLVALTEAGCERYTQIQQGLLVMLRLGFALIPADERRQLMDRLAHYAALWASMPTAQADATPNSETAQR